LIDHIIDIPPSSLPPIPPTIPSPLQYAYRTKLTPHFEAPPKSVLKAVARGEVEVGDDDAGKEKPEWLKIGFNMAGMGRVMDIEVGGSFVRVLSMLDLTSVGM
jgi:tRNA (uracil-5-)-methyltransferase